MVAYHPIVEQLTLSPPQREAVVARQGDVVVRAGAGTGKTRALVGRYLALAADGLPLTAIVAITFTRKAAREMRNRVRQEMGRFLADPALTAGERRQWQAQYSRLDAARIGTIHSLCGEILRNHPAEAGLDPRFGVLAEGHMALLRDEAVEAALAWAADDPQAVALFPLLSEDTLRQTIAALLGDRLTAAERLGRLTADVRAQWQRDLETLQDEALGQLLKSREWRTSLDALRAHEPDDPADPLAGHRQAVVAAVRRQDGQPLAGRLLELAVLDEVNLTRGRIAAWPGGKTQQDEVKAALGRLRDLWRGQTILKLRLNHLDEALAAAMPQLRAVFEFAGGHYQALKGQGHVLDFDDLEAGAIALLKERPAIRDYWQSVVQALLVDEFQDTNARQLELVRLLCPDPGRLFFVGDAKQSIYRFRGADVSVFRREYTAVAGRGGLVCRLDTCYRSHRRLVEAVNGLLRPILGQETAATPPWVAPFEPLAPHREAARHGLGPPFVELHLAAGTKRQALPLAAEALAARLAGLVAAGGLDYGDMAILCRASGSFACYEDALDRAGIPYVTVAGKGFYERPEVRDLLNALQAIADPNDDLALAGLLRSPACGLSDRALYQLSQARRGEATLWRCLQVGVALDGDDAARAPAAALLIDSLNRLAGRTTVAAVLKALLDRTGYAAALRAAGLARAARNVAKLLADAHQSQLVSVGAFLDYVTNLRQSGSREGEARATAEGAVQIMSVHQAKGLEFPLVVIGDAGYVTTVSPALYLDDVAGLVLKLADDSGEEPAMFRLGKERAAARETAEANRLLYVAATRAEEMLLISGHCRLAGGNQPRPSFRGWLKQLAGAAGLEALALDDYQAEGDGALEFEARIGETPLALTLYEPAYRPPAGSAGPVRDEAPAGRPLPSRLLDPVVELLPAPPSGERRPPRRVWRVVPAAGRVSAPPWLVGILVHEALAAWRFPGPDFQPWLAARARQHGLIDAGRLALAIEQSGRLLERLRGHSLYGAMNAAGRRLHELPYSLLREGQPEHGLIDALFWSQGQWTLVDFKTDKISGRRDLEHWLRRRGYPAQLQHYASAAHSLLGQSPRALLCLLDYDGGVLVNGDQM